MLNHIHTNGYELIELVDSAVNFVLTCKSGSDKDLFIEFIVNTKEIFIHTLINIYSYGTNVINKKIEIENNDHLQLMKKKYEEYKELVYELKEKRSTFDNENVKNLQNLDNYDNDLICIICYKEIADHRLKPCMHRGCKECLLTYMADNVKCFMCRQPIESIQMIPKEEIEKEKLKNKNPKNEEDKKVEQNKKEDIKEEGVKKNISNKKDYIPNNRPLLDDELDESFDDSF